MKNTTTDNKPKQNAPLQEILAYYGRNGFCKTSVESYTDLLTDDLVDGALVFINDSGSTYIAHLEAVYAVTGYDLQLFALTYGANSRQEELPNKINAGNYFLLYNILVDLVKIDRFCLADIEHDELFNLAHKTINELSNLANKHGNHNTTQEHSVQGQKD